MGQELKSKTNQIWVIGFPKSGNTWISYMCSYCFNLPFINFGNPKEKPQKDWVHALTRGLNEWPQLEGYDSVQKTHKQPDDVPHKGGHVIYAIRDPRDVFVSYHYFMSSKNARIMGRIRYFLLSILGKKRQIKWFLKQWEQHLDLWAPHTDLFISYDQLLGQGSEYLGEMLSRPPLSIDRVLSEEAFDQFSFEKMSGGRKAGAEDPKSFFRKGISGDWQNYFSKDEADLFVDALAKYEETLK